jgi:hypothetical protein
MRTVATKAKRKPVRFRAAPGGDSWDQVRVTEANERRQFDPLMKNFAVLADEAMERLLSGVERRDDVSHEKKVLIHELLYELAWRSVLQCTTEPIGDMHLWDDVKALIRRSEEEQGETFQFALWTLYVGGRIANAWMLRDEEFFARHADLWRSLCQTDRTAEHRAPTNVGRICTVAIALRARLGRDPTKKQVRDEVAKLGLRISEKDWPKYLRKCGLAFLPQARSGRPTKNP